MNNAVIELKKWITHGHEGSALDHARLKEIAEVTGVHPNTIKNLFNGRTKFPKPVLLDRIIKFLAMQG